MEGNLLLKYRIAGLIMEISAPDWALHENLCFFAIENGERDVFCQVIFEKRPDEPDEGAIIIAKTPGTSIYEYQNQIYNVSGDEKDIPSFVITAKDFHSCTMFVDPEYMDSQNSDTVQIVRNGIFASLRDVVIGALAQRNGLIIHSSTIIWQGKGVMFSAPSGTGKSTHTHLWQQLYLTPVLDGDAAACRIVDRIPVVYGLPWCGTSGEFINASVPLEAIVFLQQGQENSISKLDLHEAILRLASRCFLLPWNKKLMNQYFDTVQEIAESVDCYLLNCLPNPEAVELVKKCLEMKETEI